jgi:hypothetical protein
MPPAVYKFSWSTEFSSGIYLTLFLKLNLARITLRAVNYIQHTALAGGPEFLSGLLF